jgi:hypothetical protein
MLIRMVSHIHFPEQSYKNFLLYVQHVLSEHNLLYVQNALLSLHVIQSRVPTQCFSNLCCAVKLFISALYAWSCVYLSCSFNDSNTQALR